MAEDQPKTSSAPTPSIPCSKPAKIYSIVGWCIAILIGLFLFFGAISSILLLDMAVEGSAKFGLDKGPLPAIGVALLISTLLYLIPPTAILGAILLTGYFGGAVAIHVRAGDPLLNMLVPVVFGMFVWLALYLRIPELRRMVPVRCLKCRP